MRPAIVPFSWLIGQVLTQEPVRSHENYQLRALVDETPLSGLRVALLTGGGDKHYALGLALALARTGVEVDFVGSDELDDEKLREHASIHFVNLHGNTSASRSFRTKVSGVISSYSKLVRFAKATEVKIFHILWNNKIELIDRTILSVYYRLLGKRIVLTAHNVNAGERDGNDSWLNRLSLRFQYRLTSHILVHTPKMKAELVEKFHVVESKVTVIPYGLNDAVPESDLLASQAKSCFGFSAASKVLLFFGNIVAYKGIESAVRALEKLNAAGEGCRLIIAGRIKDRKYWTLLQKEIVDRRLQDFVIIKSSFIPDEEIERYFKAADVLLLPYIQIFQSGVLSLGYSFGLPVIAADVGSLKEEIIEGKTGFVFEPGNSNKLAEQIRHYFQSDLYHELEQRRSWIRDYANERYSWAKVSAATEAVYSELLKD